MNIRVGVSAFGIAVIVVLAALVQPGHGSAQVDTVAIDMNIAGNTGGLTPSLGPLNSSGTLDVGGTLEIDITVNEVPADNGINGLQYTLNYDPSVVQISSKSHTLSLLAQDPDSASVTDLSDATPDYDGTFLGALVDIGGPSGIDTPPFTADGASSETGPGILQRLTLQGVGLGTSDLTLTGVGVGDDALVPIPIFSIVDATVEVTEDADNDGLADEDDSCPLEAEDYDGYETDGCPDLDNDGDTIVDVCVDQNWDGVCDPGPISGTESAPITASELYMSRPDGMAAPLWPAVLDNCRDTENSDQADGDGDRIGDGCDSISDPDNDDDGIVNAIDGEVLGGLFRDQSAVSSESFSDTHLPLGGPTYGATYGGITDRADLTVLISDLVPNTEPEQAGVRIEASGGSGTAVVSVCQFSIVSLIAGGNLEISCGSVEAKVISGPVIMEFGTIEATLPTGTTVTIDEVSPDVFDVSVSPDSTDSVIVGGLTLAPGESAVGISDADGDSTIDDVDNCPDWPNPGQGLPPWPVPAGDPDCDGFDDTKEGFVGTLPAVQCPDDTTINNEDPDPWPPDFQDDKDVDIFDLLAMKPYFGSPAQNPYNARYDIDSQDGDVDIFDVLAMKPFFMKGCT